MGLGGCLRHLGLPHWHGTTDAAVRTTPLRPCWLASFHSPPHTPPPNQGVDLFDAAAFRLARGEAVALDPQARLLLHAAGDALAAAGDCGRTEGRLAALQLRTSNSLLRVP